jgi:methylated-DNA-protein-cysteine methyltransferase-like protein
MTYGQVARLLLDRLSARAVGWALHGCPPDVPWQRVVNRCGGISTDRLPDIPPGLQRALLEAEGVRFREDGRLDLGRYRWQPADSGPLRPPSGRLASSRSSQKER